MRPTLYVLCNIHQILIIICYLLSLGRLCGGQISPVWRECIWCASENSEELDMSVHVQSFTIALQCLPTLKQVMGETSEEK